MAVLSHSSGLQVLFKLDHSPSSPTMSPQYVAGGASDCLVIKWKADLSGVQAATRLGGESADICSSIAVDSSGVVIVSGSTRLRGFSHASAFFRPPFHRKRGLSQGLDSTFVANLVFST